MPERRGYRLFDALRRAGTAFVGGAPDPQEMQRDRGISPQMQSNIEQGRVRQFRRMRTAPRPQMTNQGVPDPFYRPRAPMSPQEAASEMTAKFGRVGVQYAPELNRFTAPDPKALAEGLRAPEFAQTKLDTEIAAASLTGAQAGTLEAKLPFVAPREEAEIAGLTGEEVRAQAEAEAGVAAQETETKLAAKGLEPEVVRQENAQQFIARLDSMIEDAREDGDYRMADQLRQQQIDLMTGKQDAGTIGGFTGVGPPAPDRTPPGGTPPIVSPVRLGREQQGDEAVMKRYGFSDEWLTSIRGGLFGTGAFKLGYGQTNTKLEQLITAIKSAPPQYAEAIIRSIRPYMSRLQILKRGPQSPMAEERKAAALVAELEQLVAFDFADNSGAPDIGGPPPMIR